MSNVPPLIGNQAIFCIECFLEETPIIQQFLRDPQFNINFRMQNGETPFISCCLQEKKDIVRMLLETGHVNLRMRVKGKTVTEIVSNDLLHLIKKYDTG